MFLVATTDLAFTFIRALIPRFGGSETESIVLQLQCIAYGNMFKDITIFNFIRRTIDSKIYRVSPKSSWKCRYVSSP